MRRLIDTIPSSGPDIFYDPNFHATLEYHIPRLQKHEETEYTGVEPAIGIKYRGDFFGFLNTLGIPSHYHWVVMRCNNFYTPMEFSETTHNVIIPPLNEIDEIAQIYTTSNNI